MPVLTSSFTYEADYEGEPWSFSVRIPNLDVMDRLEELLIEQLRQQRGVLLKMAKDTELQAYMANRDDSLDMERDPKFAELIVKQFGNDEIAGGPEGPVQGQVAAVLLESGVLGEPRGWTDADGAPVALTWAQIMDADAPYGRAVLASVAFKILGRVSGTEGKVRIKN